MTNNRKIGAGREAIRSWDSRIGVSACGGTAVVFEFVGEGGTMFQRIVPLSSEEGRHTGGCDVTGHQLPSRLNTKG